MADLQTVINCLRRRLTRREANRRRALAYYHAHPERRNRTSDKRRALETTFRRVLVRRQDEQLDFFGAIRRLEKRLVRRSLSKLKKALRRRFEKVVSGKDKSARAQALVGISIEGLRAHLEAQFQPGMTWENHSFTGWHVDHIRPLASFDLTQEDQQKQAFHYTNLQPLWQKQNFEKRDKILV